METKDAKRDEGKEEQPQAVQVAAVVQPPVPAEERHETWRKLVIAALGLAWPKRFATIAVPARFAEPLAAEFRRIGFGARTSAVGRPADTRTLAIWEPVPATQAERMVRQWGRALHRDGLVIEEGYRHGIEMTDEDVRQGAWFG